jgi:hypothetical protein
MPQHNDLILARCDDARAEPAFGLALEWIPRLSPSRPSFQRRLEAIAASGVRQRPRPVEFQVIVIEPRPRAWGCTPQQTGIPARPHRPHSSLIPPASWVPSQLTDGRGTPPCILRPGPVHVPAHARTRAGTTYATGTRPGRTHPWHMLTCGTRRRARSRQDRFWPVCRRVRVGREAEDLIEDLL